MPQRRDRCLPGRLDCASPHGAVKVKAPAGSPEMNYFIVGDRGWYSLQPSPVAAPVPR
jgi:hypothetical protein